MTDPNCQPESVEAQLLREMIEEFRGLRRGVGYMRFSFGSSGGADAGRERQRDDRRPWATRTW